MFKTISEHEFRRAFEELRPENFSHEGLGLLFDWFEEYEDSTGEPLELDVIAICCDWAESDAAEIMQDFSIGLDDIGLDADDEPDADAIADALLDYLNDRTSVAGMTDAGTIVYCSF